MSFFSTPAGMSRRHFMRHLAGSAALVGPAMALTNSFAQQANDLKRRGKSAILLWMGGGPATIDIWDLKPGAATGGEFKPISTDVAGVQISEHMPETAKVMKHLSIVRSMSTREADHNRGRYYMHTGYVPNPNMEHPSYGSVLAHELLAQRQNTLEIPPFVAVGGGSVGPGFLGMAWAPFVVGSNGEVRNLQMGIDDTRLQQRMKTLELIEGNFIKENRGLAATEHAKILGKTQALMTSKQMEAFKVNKEPADVLERYGNSGFARGCLMARRLVETGVPFVEVDLGGWDTHNGNFAALRTKLPEMDKAIGALVSDLVERGLYDDTAIIWMGEFGRTPRINGGAGRDHWARSWSVVVGGAGFARGAVVGKTNADGTDVDSEPYSAEDLMASVCQSVGISLETTFTSRSGRPMKIANGGKVIKELFT
jgi:uncharacterized protein (DUF1501 family)